MIKLLSIEIEGFGSISRPLTYNFETGLHFIKGENGIGKTTLFSALTWGLFQVNLKGLTNDMVETWKAVRPLKYKGTKVVIRFNKDSDNYLVERCLNYTGNLNDGKKGSSRLSVYKNGIPYEGQHKAHQQEYINTVLGMNATLFLNSVLFGQSLTRLLEASEADKRKIFDNIFSVDFVEIAKERCKELRAEYKTESKVNEEMVKSAQRAVEEAINNIYLAELDNENQLNRHNININGLKDKLDAHVNSVEKLQERKRIIIKQLKESKHSEQVKSYDTLTAEMEEIQHKVDALSEEHRLKSEELDRKINHLSFRIKGAQQYITSSESLLYELQQQEIEAKRQDNQKITDAVNDYAQNLAKLENDLKVNKESLEKTQKKLAELRAYGIQTHCPVCKQSIESHKIEEAKTNLANALHTAALEEEKATKALESAELKVKKMPKVEEVKALTTCKVQKERGDFYINLEEQKQKLETHIKDAKTKEAVRKADIQILTNSKDSKEYKETLDNYRSSYKALKLKREAVEEEAKKLNLLEAEATKIDTDIKVEEASFFTLRDMIKSLEANPPLLRNIQELKEALKDKELLLNEATTKKDLVDKNLSFAEWWMKEGFGTNGIKAYIFGAMLQKLNSYLSKYTSRVGFQVVVGVDFNTASMNFYTQIYRGEDIVYYEELSGGQKQRVNIVMAFALSDMVGEHLNILLLDEVFESLDSSGIELVFDLIRDKSDYKSVQLITHLDNADAYKAKTVQVMQETDSECKSYTIIR